MESKKHPAFSEDDIVNIFPIVKHVEPQVTANENFLEKLIIAILDQICSLSLNI